MSKQETAEEFNASFAEWTGIDFMALARQALSEPTPQSDAVKAFVASIPANATTNMIRTVIDRLESYCKGQERPKFAGRLVTKDELEQVIAVLREMNTN